MKFSNFFFCFIVISLGWLYYSARGHVRIANQSSKNFDRISFDFECEPRPGPAFGDILVRSGVEPGASKTITLPVISRCGGSLLVTVESNRDRHVIRCDYYASHGFQRFAITIPEDLNETTCI